MLFFYVAQEFPNAVGPSPLGSCKSDGTGDASCPDIAMGETFYACPPQGCITYKVTLNDATYAPAPSTCAVYPKYAQPAPTYAAPAPAPAPAPTSFDEMTAQLKQLAGLKDQGILTDEEFATQKARILGT